MNYLNLSSSPVAKIQFDRTSDFMQVFKAKVDVYFRMTGQMGSPAGTVAA